MLFIAGGTGFIGHHLINALIERGYKLRCLVRSKQKASQLRAMGIETVIGDITDASTIKGALKGCSMVVHLVGIIEEHGSLTFKAVHVDGTDNLVKEAVESDIKHFFYQSALGASLSSWAGYLTTKAEAEEIVRESRLRFTIFRPSLVIGSDDGFTQKIKEIAYKSPLIPIPGRGDARFQPIYVGDWVKCFMKIIDNPHYMGHVYEFGGPEHLTYKEMVEAIINAMGIRKPIIHVPMGLTKFGISFMERLIPKPPATSEQIRLLEVDNICDIGSVKNYFGFEPIRFKDALKLFIKSPKGG